MQAAGLSARKIEYLVDLALHFDSGAIHAQSWTQMADEDIIAELIGIRGIGRWTAEMFLIFHLMRPNVLPLDDVGLINGIGRSGQPQRCPRSGGGLGSVLQRGNLVYLALAGPIASGILNMAPTLVTSCTALPPEGAAVALGRPGGD